MKADKQKFVCVFPDYIASGLWAYSKVSMPLEDLPISEELKEEINLMNIAYDQEETWKNIPERHDYDVWSYNLALKIKKELPDWEVEFLNNGNILGLDLPVNNRRSSLK